ncbi:hypothetical protein, partial [Hominenteromicrobium sp.]|uniref:hypothetical protein n=1 Tax=Hominenteromicrobium sp. TaxID=3073581 RepID=UPI003A9513A6
VLPSHYNDGLPECFDTKHNKRCEPAQYATACVIFTLWMHAEFHVLRKEDSVKIHQEFLLRSFPARRPLLHQ